MPMLAAGSHVRHRAMGWPRLSAREERRRLRAQWRRQRSIAGAMYRLLDLGDLGCIHFRHRR
ncbi:hypothetical protein, partial [Xanthomonas phaseoli]|uniref:hypothetical protein n=1 Tax=Xanthomonas phaseoli TaxID=1985254 RepID=UPI00196A00AE